MKTERISKYYKLLKAIAKKKKLTNKEFMAFVKEHKCSTSIGTILVDGGVMRRVGTIYHWVSPVCTIDTTVKALELLHKYNQASYQRRKSERKNLEQEFIATMPKAKVKKMTFKELIAQSNLIKHESVDVNESSDSVTNVTNVTWFWGLYTKTKWYS